MKFRRPAIATFTTSLIVATAAAAWAVASPAGISCAFAAEQGLIAAAPSESNGFIASINNLRISKGLNALSVDGNMTDIAQSWANSMALADGISHRSDLRAGVTGDWSTLGENVGVGPSVDSLMDAFIASPGHYKNLVDPRFTHVGVGTVRVGGIMYTAHEFMAVRGGAPAPAPVVTAPPVTSAPRVRTVAAPKPAVTVPPTTVPAPPTTVAPAPTNLPTEVQELHTDEQLDDGGKHNDEKQQSKSNRRCRPHLPNLQALVK